MTPPRAAKTALSALAVAVLAACAARPRAPAAPVARGALHGGTAPGMADAMVAGARLVPEKIDDTRSTYGVEPGGGVRTIVAGMRVATFAGGTLVTSPDRFSANVSDVIALPARLGGGFLFQSGQSLWRSDKWLGEVSPLFTSPVPITRVSVGLDRLYVKSQTGAYAAYDVRSGASLDLGPMPSTPLVAAFGAIDGWRAVGIADLRGVVATSDAGATWRALGLPIDAREIVEEDGAVAVGGLDSNRMMQWWEVRADGQVARTTAPAPRAAESTKSVDLALVAATRPFGSHPLAVAVEDGWPLTDGTAVVARDGAIARVRLQDGALVEASADAYPLHPSRCHPVSLARDRDPAAFGFACGEAHDATVVYRFDAPSGRMIELKRFDAPRVVVSSGNGALVVHGACTARDVPAAPGEHSYCLFGRDDAWREIHVRGDVGGERVVALKDGRVAVLSPPRSDLATTRITILDKGKASTAGVAFPPIAAEVARALKLGVWLDGFEERAAGVIGGWVDAGASVVGVEIAADGVANVGKYVRDAGLPFVSGRFGFGYTAAHSGYETTDGGMTWERIDLPDLLAQPRAVAVRACGPVGSIAGGWLRVGWGDATNAERVDASPPSVPPAPPHRPSRPIELDCEPTAGDTPEPPKPPAKKPRPDAAATPTLSPYGGGYYGGYYGARGVEELPAFFGLGAPAMKDDDLGATAEITQVLERTVRAGTVGRVYAWGDRTADWEKNGRWLVRWVWPYGGWGDARGTQTTVAPYATLDDALRNVGGAYGMPQWSLAIGDDASHALAVARRQAPFVQSYVLALDADRPPLEVRRADGEPLGEIDAAARVAGHWYVVTRSAPYVELPSATLWSLDGAVAREIARVPRSALATSNEQPQPVRIATRPDGSSIGLVVRGQPMERRNASELWLVAVDVASGAVADPIALAPDDFDGASLRACSDDDDGWTFDAALDHRAARVRVGSTTTQIQQPLVRVRVSGGGRTCIERFAGDLDYYASRATDAFTKGKATGKGLAATPIAGSTIPAAVYTAAPSLRFALRCAAH